MATDVQQNLSGCDTENDTKPTLYREPVPTRSLTTPTSKQGHLPVFLPGHPTDEPLAHKHRERIHVAAVGRKDQEVRLGRTGTPTSDLDPVEAQEEDVNSAELHHKVLHASVTWEDGGKIHACRTGDWVYNCK